MPCRIYQPGLVTPPNLYLAQLGRRRQLAGAARLQSQTLETDGPAPAPAAADGAAGDVQGEVEGHRRPPLLEELTAVEPSAAPAAEQGSLGLDQPSTAYDPDLLDQLVEQQPAAVPTAASDAPQLR